VALGMRFPWSNTLLSDSARMVSVRILILDLRLCINSCFYDLSA
jgi:hypothetical protein